MRGSKDWEKISLIAFLMYPRDELNIYDIERLMYRTINLSHTEKMISLLYLKI